VGSIGEPPRAGGKARGAPPEPIRGGGGSKTRGTRLGGSRSRHGGCPPFPEVGARFPSRHDVAAPNSGAAASYPGGWCLTGASNPRCRSRAVAAGGGGNCKINSSDRRWSRGRRAIKAGGVDRRGPSKEGTRRAGVTGKGEARGRGVKLSALGVVGREGGVRAMCARAGGVRSRTAASGQTLCWHSRLSPPRASARPRA